MNILSSSFQNIETQSNKYIFCPSSCLNIPEIHYLYNPFYTKFVYKCKCMKNNDKEKEMDLQEFLEKSSHLICFICKRKLLDDKINYCRKCNIIIDSFCLGYHQKLFHDIKINEKIFNYCPEHGSQFIFRCMECGQSLCNNCDLNCHNDKSHTLNQITKFSIKQNEFYKLKETFDKQKDYFGKIKLIFNNWIQTLENDIKIKERIINNYMLYKSDYNSYLNLKNLFIHNNEKYEKYLENILTKDKEVVNNYTYVNKFLSILFYSLMINKEEEINNCLINNLVKKVLSLRDLNKGSNCTDNKIDNINNCNNFYNNFEKMDFSFAPKIFSEIKFINNNNDGNINNIQNENNNKKIFDINLQQFSNFNFSIQRDINKINSSLNNSNISLKDNNKENNDLNSETSSSEIISENDIPNEPVKKSKSFKKKKLKKIKKQKIDKKEKNENTLLKNYEENSSRDKENLKNKNYIFNIILLKTGNIAISRKEAVEIYNLRNLDFSWTNYIHDNNLIQKDCLLQRINLVKDRYIRNVLELFDGTLLCATNGKIFRIKLTNDDSNYEILSFIKLENSDIPTKLISLGDSFLLVLIEYKYNCKIKIFQRNDNLNNEQINSKENKQIDESINHPNINKNEIITNCADVPAIGNSLYFKKEIGKDKSFKLLHKNINENKKLWISIYPIKKNENNNKKENDGYLYEFIATSNAYYQLGDNKVAFFGLKKNKKDEYYVKKIKEINDLPCSTETDSICQINEKYLFIALKNLLIEDQKSGFAIIDISKRELCNIIEEHEISCICYSPKNNLLLASMEIINSHQNYFATKIYKIIQNKKNDNNHSNEEIELKMVYEYRNKQTDIITSIQYFNLSYSEMNLEDGEYENDLIFVTSSNDSTLEIVKADI